MRMERVQRHECMAHEVLLLSLCWTADMVSRATWRPLGNGLQSASCSVPVQLMYASCRVCVRKCQMMTTLLMK